MGRVSIQPIDIFLVAALGGLSEWLARSHSPLHIAGSAIVTTVCVAVAWLSHSTFVWLSKYTNSASDLTNLRHVRKAGRKLPCPYPDAWYAVAHTHELKPGSVVPVTVCGHDLVVYRPENGGPPAILDAYCSHLGAHLALGPSGGSVQGDCVRCPFHGWCFGPDGTLRSTPTSDAITGSRSTSIASWPCLERNGVISVFMNSRMHADKFAEDAGNSIVHNEDGSATCSRGHLASAVAGSADQVAASLFPKLDHMTKSSGERFPVVNNTVVHDIPVYPEVDGPNPPFTYHGFTENIVNAIIYDIAENGADMSHLHVVHDEFFVPALYPMFSHKWKGTWVAGEKGGPREFIADMTVEERVCLFGIALPGEVRVKIAQVGPAHVYLEMNTPVGSLLVCETVTPVSPMQLRIMHAVYASPWVPRVLVKAVMSGHIVHHEKDVPVWCHKKYMPSASGGAQLVKSDALIKLYRDWTRRFYDGDSITFEQAMRQHLRDSLGMPQDSVLQW